MHFQFQSTKIYDSANNLTEQPQELCYETSFFEQISTNILIYRI